MTVTQRAVELAAGDGIAITLFVHGGEEPWILVSVVDADEMPVPTVSLSIAEAAELREALRELLEEGARARGRRQRGGLL